MKRFLSFVGLCFVLMARGTDKAAAQSPSPLGTWQVVIHGTRDKGITYLTFTNDFTFSGYGISRKSFGMFTVDGTWTNDARGRVVAGYTLTTPDTAFSGHMRLKLRSSGNRFIARVRAQNGRFFLTGKRADNVLDLTGDWVARIKKRRSVVFEQYALTESMNFPAVFDIAGQGITASGEIILTSHNRAAAFVANDPLGNGPVTNSVVGRFEANGDVGRLHGTDDSRRRVRIKFLRRSP